MCACSSEDSSRSPTPSSPSTTPSSPAELCQADAEHFAKWRPSYHLQPSGGWMNDPCAPGYDPKTGLYHVSFQWNPNGYDWGDIAWGSATSSDMISWVVNEQPVLSPNMPYDRKGVFTGCFISTPDTCLTYAYTSVSLLPIHHTIPHQRGSESLSIARSFDSGKTWVKSANNPILPAEPLGLDVTGWRDPFCAPWPRMSELMGLDVENTLFGIIAGGIRNITPTAFLYIVDANDVGKWTYVGPLVNVGLNMRPSRWSGDLGTNWEVTNFLTLKDEGDSPVSRDLLIMGTEGCLSEDGTAPTDDAGPSRPCRAQLWMSGSLRNEKSDKGSGAISMTYNFGGHIDHGCLYAANSFFDLQRQRQVLWGWITEDDLCDNLRHLQGWSGMLSMPRELFMQTHRNVTSALVSELSSITSIELEDNEDGSFTVRTLASQPYQPLIESLRHGPNVRQARLERSNLRCGANRAIFTSDQIQSTTWELNCSFNISRLCSKVGVIIGHSTDFSSVTTLMFEPPSETFTIIRPSFPTPNSSELINSSPEIAPHTLFTRRDPATGEEDMETLHIQAWRDNSVLEVFINHRTVISTRIYAAEETFGVRFFAEDSGAIVGGQTQARFGATELLHAALWDDIGIV